MKKLSILFAMLSLGFGAMAQKSIFGARIEGEMIFNDLSFNYTEDGGTTNTVYALDKGQAIGLMSFYHYRLSPKQLWLITEVSYMIGTEKYKTPNGEEIKMDYNPMVARVLLEKRFAGTLLGIQAGASGAYELGNNRFTTGYSDAEGNTKLVPTGIIGFNILFKSLNITARYNHDITESKYTYVRNGNPARYFSQNQRRQFFSVGLGLNIDSE